MPGFIADLGGKEEDGFGEMRMNPRDPFCRNVERGIFVLRKEGHDLADSAFQFFIKRTEFSPRNVSRPIPVTRRRLIVEVGSALAVCLVAIDDLEGKLGGSFFNSSAARRKAGVRLGDFLNSGRMTHQ